MTTVYAQHRGPALVVLSGGQDSMTCLALAMRQHTDVSALFFNYGQRHITAEYEAACRITNRWRVPLRSITLEGVVKQVAPPSALLNREDSVSAPSSFNSALPASFVPGRNMLFLTVAMTWAASRAIEHVYTGVCQTDYSGYPDCREAFVTAMQEAFNVGYSTDIAIHTPLMFKSKAETFKLAEDLGALPEILELSHTCYEGSRKKQEWGHGCGECPACKLRALGWYEYLNPTPVTADEE